VQITLSLQQYRDLLSDIPRPSAEQRARFSVHVAGAHSWYKHLPQFYPGTDFFFFLDRYAGCGFEQDKDGKTRPLELISRGPHYSVLKTHEHRERFGHLRYENDRSTTVVVGIDGRIYALPSAVLEAGRVELTALVHDIGLAQELFLGSQLYRAYLPAGSDTPKLRVVHAHPDMIERAYWPEASGGIRTLKKIAARYRELQAGAARQPVKFKGAKAADSIEARRFELTFRGTDAVIYELLLPEQQRQRREIVNAIDRVYSLIETAN
jgi:hypothetical protein